MRRRKYKGRPSLRQSGQDYRGIGTYFLTMQCADNEALFGEVIDGEMVLNDFGQIVDEAWVALQERYPYLLPGPRQVMPTHFHGLPEYDPRLCPPHVVELLAFPRIVGAFKYDTTVRINKLRGTPEAKVWQRNYWDVGIRDARHYRRVERYIEENPRRWWKQGAGR